MFFTHYFSYGLIIFMDNYFALVEKDYKKDEIFGVLLNPVVEDFEKIFAIININGSLSKSEFKTLINLLSNHPTPLREMTAFRWNYRYQY